MYIYISFDIHLRAAETSTKIRFSLFSELSAQSDRICPTFIMSATELGDERECQNRRIYT